MKITRRSVLQSGALTIAGMGMNGPGIRSSSKTYRAAVIGRTGGGDYGHGYDQVFKGLDNVIVEAVADQDPAGLMKAAERSGARRTYGDYREMLRAEKPDLVAITPRHPDCHREMALDSIRVCRGIFIEKPLSETLVDSDAILDAAAQAGTSILVAHNRRWTADFVQVKALVDRGLIGQVREIHIQGKQDARVGAEDMIVLGVHDFDLMRLYFGDPAWCQASVRTSGREITGADVHKGREPYTVAGDSIHALFGFANNIVAHWSSVKTDDTWNAASPKVGDKWAFEILGTRGLIGYRSGVGFSWLDSPYHLGNDAAVHWQELPKPAAWNWPEEARHPIKSLIHAIETGGSPVCSGADGRWAVEMTAAVYESERTKSRVLFPLRDRTNPLVRF
jgi:predicted dehydrogenase